MAKQGGRSARARRKRREAKAAIRRAGKATTVQLPKRRHPELVSLYRHNGRGAHSSPKGDKGYQRHPKHKSRKNF